MRITSRATMLPTIRIKAKMNQPRSPHFMPELTCSFDRVEIRNIGARGSWAISGAMTSCRSRAWPTTYSMA